jgi:hypothetical protein
MITPSSYLIPQEGMSPVLDVATRNLFNAHNVALGSALTLVLQPPFSNDLLVTLPEDQALAAQHATIFKNGWGFGVANAFITGLTTISTFVLALTTGELGAIAAALDGMSPSSPGYADKLKEFRQLIASISAACCDSDPDSGSLLLEMNQMIVNLTDLSGQIDDDDTRMRTAITEVKKAALISQLEAQQRALQEQLASVNGKIAEGASTTIASDIEFGFSFATEFADDGITPGAIGGAALSIAGEADAIKQFQEQTQALSDQQTQLNHQIFELANTLDQDRADAMTLTLTAAQIGVFNAQIKGILADISSLVSQMSDWGKALALLSEFSTPPGPRFYSDQVTAGTTYWRSLKATLDRYQRIMALSVTSSSSN